MSAIRIHTKNSSEILNFLQRNKKDFQTEKTSSGFPTFNYGDKAIYIRDKVVNRGALNKILTFQTQVTQSDLYKYINRFSCDNISEETLRLEKTLLYKGFLFNPFEETNFQQVIKIDLNAAYWQTCRYFGVVQGETYRQIMRKCTKPTRLRITGTLGKKVTVTDYIKGKKVDSYLKDEKKKRIIFQNLYNRIRKFVDELMMWCWQTNPSNFIGYYVDCLWLREYDDDLIKKLQKIYKLKIELVDLYIKTNNHGKMVLIEDNGDDLTPYDAQFKSNEFVNYKNLYNFTRNLDDIILKIRDDDRRK